MRVNLLRHVLLLGACCIPPSAAQSPQLPHGPQVTAGAASFQTSGGTLHIANSSGTIINWQSFSIGAGARTNFQQPSALSAVLNRVTGTDPSQILGALTSNGKVFLVNPHGIVFGAGTRIDTAAFVASTLDISDADFLAGRLKFAGGGHGVLKNEGTLRASGDIYLVGPQIENTGIVRSDNGSVLLAAGRSLTITSPDAHGVQFALQAPADTALNLGVIEAKNAAGMFAGTLRHSGEIRAESASLDGAGRVILRAAQDVILDGNALISADNAAGRGGRAEITGERVGLLDGATVSARGAAGGGEILVGGDYQGENPAVRNAAMTHVGAAVTLDASASGAGDGGRIIVWADDTARVQGRLDARGGPQGGAGGFIETSGKRHLDVSGIRLSATGTAPGTWLLDPYDIEVVAGAGTVNNSGATAFTPIGDTSQIGADLIVGQLDAGTSVTLNTTGAGTQAGNITVNSAIVKTNNNAASLTLAADNDIAVNANITLPNASAPGDTASVTLNAGGNVTINNATVQAGSIYVTAGGAIQRSGAQTNDFVFGRGFPDTGTLSLVANGGAIGASAQPIRFRNTIDSYGRGWSANTAAAGAGGHIHLQPTSNIASITSSLNIQTDTATTQTVWINHTGTTDLNLFSDVSGNDDWTINTGGNFRSCNFGGCAGGHFTLTGHSFNVTAAGDLGASGSYGPHALFDTSAANGNIVLTAASIDGTGCGGGNYGVGVKPGSGSITATSTGSGCGGSIQLIHYGGDLLASKYTLNFTGGSAGNYVRLKAGDGHLILDSTAGFNTSLNDKAVLLQTLAAGKDILFQGGTVQGGRVEVRATGNIDNLASGIDGFIQTNAFGDPYWMLVAGGGIGPTHPVEGKANWVGSLVTSGAGAAGDIRVKFTGGSTPRIGEVRTAAGSAQTIDIQSTVGLIFSTAQPGYIGVGGSGSSSSTDNDHYTVNATGSISFDNFDNSFTADTISMTSGASIVQGASGGGLMMSASGLMTVNANGGSIGSSGNYARLRGTGSRQLYALNDVYINAGTNPLTLSGIATGAGAGTIGLTTTAANDLTFGGTTNINDALVLSIGGNILFPAGASFTTSGGLTLNSPTQIASTATVNVTGGTLSGTAALTNAGTLTKGNAGTSTFSGGFANSGTVNVNAGTLDLAGGYTDAGGTLMMGGGGINAPGGGLILNTGTLGGSGTLTGNLVNNGGTLIVGSSPGTMTINGNLALGPSSVIDIELGGTSQGVSYDLLSVTGTATLGGTMNVGLHGGFTGSAGDVFDVITYASRSGDFATVNFPPGYGITATPNPTFYRLLVDDLPSTPGVSPAPFDQWPLLLAAREVRILRDKFFYDVHSAQEKKDADERQEGALECR